MPELLAATPGGGRRGSDRCGTDGLAGGLLGGVGGPGRRMPGEEFERNSVAEGDSEPLISVD